MNDKEKIESSITIWGLPQNNFSFVNYPDWIKPPTSCVRISVKNAEGSTQIAKNQEPIGRQVAAADQAMTLAMTKIDQKREWVGLTKQEFEQAVDGLEDLEDCWIQIEAKLKEKNA